MKLDNYKILFIKFFFFFALIIPKHTKSFETTNIDQHLKHSVEIFEHCLIHKTRNRSIPYDTFITTLIDPLAEGSNLNPSQKVEIYFLSQTLWSYFNHNILDVKNKQDILNHWLKLGQQWEEGLWSSNLDLSKKTSYFDKLSLCQQELQKDKSKGYDHFNGLYKKSANFLKNFIPVHYKNSKEFSANQLQAIQSAADVISILSTDLIPNSLRPVILTNNSNQNVSVSSRGLFSFLWNWLGSKEIVVANVIPQAPKLINLSPKKYMRALPSSSVQELKETQKKMGLVQPADEEGINEISVSPASVQNQDKDERKLVAPIINNLPVQPTISSDLSQTLMGDIKSFSRANLKITKLQKVKKIQIPEEYFSNLNNNNEPLAKLVEKILIRTNEKLKEVQSLEYYGQTTKDVHTRIFSKIKQFLLMPKDKRRNFLSIHNDKLKITKQYLKSTNPDPSLINNLWFHEIKTSVNNKEQISFDLTASISVSDIKSVWDNLTDKTKSEIFASEVFIKLCDPGNESNIMKTEEEFNQLKNLFRILIIEANSHSEKFPWLIPSKTETLFPEQAMIASLFQSIKQRRPHIQKDDKFEENVEISEWGMADPTS